MPTIGDQVAVRALVSMPGVDEGHVLVVQWGPRLATLVDRRRYELVQDPTTGPVHPAEPVEREAPSSEADASADPPSDGAPTVPRRARGR